MTVMSEGWHGLCFRAMNTRVEVQLYAVPAGDPPAKLLDGVENMFRRAETHMSRFLEDSELSRLNRAGTSGTQVSHLLFGTIEMAVWAAQATNGLFDPTVLPALKAVGYNQSFELVARRKVTNRRQDAPAPGYLGYRSITLDRHQHTVSKPDQVELDLGGIGKGWTVDRASDWIAGLHPFLVNAGGDLYAFGTPPGRSGWSIGLIDPFDDSGEVDRIQVHEKAVATSTISRRRWRQGEDWVHHLIDPRTGRPANTDAVSVSIIAARVSIAEVLAKVALILGVEPALMWLERLPKVEGLIVTKSREIRTTSGWSQYQEDNRQ